MQISLRSSFLIIGVVALLLAIMRWQPMLGACLAICFLPPMLGALLSRRVGSRSTCLALFGWIRHRLLGAELPVLRQFVLEAWANQLPSV